MATGRFEFDVRDEVYERDGDREYLIRLWIPRGEGPFPTILNIHGGVWVRAERTRNEVLSEALAERGVLVAGLDIHTPPDGGYPSSMRDVNLAVRWLKAHAAELGGTRRVGAIGTSSGGHQVELLGMLPFDPKYADLPGEPGVDATIAYGIPCWPVTDPLYRYHLIKKAGEPELYISGHEKFWGTEEAMAEGSPQGVLERGEEIQTPPMLIVQKGEGDALHPVEMQERFIKGYSERGGEVAMIALPGLPMVFERIPACERMLDEFVMDFIHRHS